jgi:hypothetical protein
MSKNIKKAKLFSLAPLACENSDPDWAEKECLSYDMTILGSLNIDEDTYENQGWGDFESLVRYKGKDLKEERRRMRCKLMLEEGKMSKKSMESELQEEVDFLVDNSLIRSNAARMERKRKLDWIERTSEQNVVTDDFEMENCTNKKSDVFETPLNEIVFEDNFEEKDHLLVCTVDRCFCQKPNQSVNNLTTCESSDLDVSLSIATKKEIINFKKNLNERLYDQINKKSTKYEEEITKGNRLLLFLIESTTICEPEIVFNEVNRTEYMKTWDKLNTIKYTTALKMPFANDVTPMGKLMLQKLKNSAFFLSIESTLLPVLKKHITNSTIFDNLHFFLQDIYGKKSKEIFERDILTINHLEIQDPQLSELLKKIKNLDEGKISTMKNINEENDIEIGLLFWNFRILSITLFFITLLSKPKDGNLQKKSQRYFGTQEEKIPDKSYIFFQYRIHYNKFDK